MTTRLIAFTGKVGSGKDTAAERFAILTSLPTIRLSFARKLKESAAACFGIEALDWEDFKNNPDIRIVIEHAKSPSRHIAEVTAREFLQRYGTEAHRDIFGSDFWVNQGLVEYDSYVGPDALFFVTDCRFENEAEAIRKRGGFIVSIVGPNDKTGGHSSEAGLPAHLTDCGILNVARDDDFAQLDNSLRSLAEELGIPVIVWA